VGYVSDLGVKYRLFMVLRLVLAEDSFLMREGITSLLALDDDLDLVASAESYDGLLAAVEEHHPDVVLTDIRMPPTQTDEGIRAANIIRADHPEIGVVVLSQYVEPDYAMRLFEDGSEGRAYLLKERVADLDELSAAIHKVHAGGSVVDPKVVEALINARNTDDGSILDRLTEREHEVLAEMAKGGNNSAIGEALFISARSVEKHIGSIFTKLDLSESDDTNRRVRAVLLYVGLGPD
jgi:DNA-binding NarL/FixJ family response regulator